MVQALQAHGVDPRTATWEVDEPVFWVVFFRPDPETVDLPAESASYSSDEWELTGGDVAEALAWAAEHAGPERTWMLYVVVAKSPSEPIGLIRLAGTDPNARDQPG